MHSSSHKDTRWFSFWDHAVAHDQNWHVEAMCLGFTYWLDGANPWDLKPPELLGSGVSETYSARLAVWHAARLS